MNKKRFIINYALTIFLFFLAVILCKNSIVFAQDNDYDFYKKSLESKKYFKSNTVVAENESYKKDYQDKINVLKNFTKFSEIDKQNLVANPQSYSYQSNLFWNGNFESGHINWDELYKYSGSWYDYDYIITNGSGGYGSWYAYMIDDQYLKSYYNRAPINTVDFRVSYDYRLVHWGCESYSYGLNGVAVYLHDVTTNNFEAINLHNAETDIYNHSYVSTSFLVSSVASLGTVSNHDIYIDFMHFNEDPNCSLAFYLDNVSVEPVIYVPDYSITTSAGANGSISSGTTLQQGSSYTAYVTPNLGYEIYDVLVDGVSVGPVKYYTFSNVSSSHNVQASFQVANSTSQRIYRFWSNRGKHHFYTSSEDEFTNVVNNYPAETWRYEQVGYRAFTTQQQDTVALYRFWSDQYQGHFYTASEDEKNNVINNNPNWRYEQVAYYVYGTDYTGVSIPVYRFWSDNYNGHFYTSSETERNNVINNDPNWRYEGSVFKIPSN